MLLVTGNPVTMEKMKKVVKIQKISSHAQKTVPLRVFFFKISDEHLCLFFWGGGGGGGWGPHTKTEEQEKRIEIEINNMNEGLYFLFIALFSTGNRKRIIAVSNEL